MHYISSVTIHGLYGSKPFKKEKLISFLTAAMLEGVSSVGIVMGYGLGNQGSVLDGGKTFLLFHIVQTGSDTSPAHPGRIFP
jgi:hypothetical protein